MDAISRETFNKWARNHKWMQIAEHATPNGRQYTFITPAGNMTLAMFDIKGNLIGIGQPVPVGQAQLNPLQKK